MARTQYKFVVYLDGEKRRKVYLVNREETPHELLETLDAKCILGQFPANFSSEEHEDLFDMLIRVQTIMNEGTTPGFIELFEEVVGMAVDAAEKHYCGEVRHVRRKG